MLKKIKSKIKSSDLIPLRPGLGVNPFFIYKFIGKKLKQNVKKNQLVKYSLVN